jgi:hypothetical protein
MSNREGRKIQEVLAAKLRAYNFVGQAAKNPLAHGKGHPKHPLTATQRYMNHSYQIKLEGKGLLLGGDESGGQRRDRPTKTKQSQKPNKFTTSELELTPPTCSTSNGDACWSSQPSAFSTRAAEMPEDYLPRRLTESQIKANYYVHAQMKSKYQATPAYQDAQSRCETDRVRYLKKMSKHKGIKLSTLSRPKDYHRGPRGSPRHAIYHPHPRP